jgi:hypothetical protein
MTLLQRQQQDLQQWLLTVDASCLARSSWLCSQPAAAACRQTQIIETSAHMLKEWPRQLHLTVLNTIDR